MFSKIIIISIFLLLSTNLYGQFSFLEKKDKLWGVMGGLNFNNHTADFVSLSDFSSCCEKFQGGAGTGLYLGGLYEVRLDKQSYIGASLNYSVLSGLMAPKEDINIKVDGKPYLGKISHTLNTDIHTLPISLYYRNNIFDKISVSGGLSFGLVTLSRYDYIEEIIDPVNRGVFLDTEKQTRNPQQGNLQKGSSLLNFINFGVEYELPLNKENDLFIYPNLFYRIALNNVATDVSWSISTISIGVAIRKFNYANLEDPPPPPVIKDTVLVEQFIIDTLVVENNRIAVSKYNKGYSNIIISLEDLGDKISKKIIEKRTDTLHIIPKPDVNLTTNVEEIIIKARYVTEAFPLLPYIFFDKSSSELSDYYFTDNISEFEKLKNEPLEFHSKILPIIAMRLNDNPNLEITLRGYADETSENGDCELAFARGKTVYDILTKKLNVNPKQIDFKKIRNCSPAKETKSNNEEAYKENSRVEISSKDLEVLEPIVKNKFLEFYEISVDEVLFSDNSERKISEKSSKYSLFVDDKQLESNSQNKIELNNQIISKLFGHNHLKIVCEVENNEGKIVKQEKSINLVSDTSDIVSERLSLILFDVGSAEVSKKAKENVIKFVKLAKSTSEIIVSGYADIIGETNLNLKLSGKRASNTKDIITGINDFGRQIKINNFGFEKFPRGINSYNTPQERFLSRTVMIEIFHK